MGTNNISVFQHFECGLLDFMYYSAQSGFKKYSPKSKSEAPADKENSGIKYRVQLFHLVVFK